MQDNNTKGLLKTYIVGLLLCIVVTCLSFWVTGSQVVTGKVLVLAIAVLALLQFYIQLRCFLHLSLKPDARWDLFSFIFTLVIVVVLVAGSVWIMFSLNNLMM